MPDAELNPMQLLGRVSSEGARTYMEHRAAIMDNPALAALPLQVKLLIGIGVAAALQSSRCTLMWAKQARQAGVSDEQMVEAVLVARLMKAATVNDAAADALAWLKE
jgi:AhpD family alkylhydroperoxidase